MVGTEIASFTVCEDPALNARHGDRLRFEQVLPHFELTPRFADIKNWDVFQGILLAVTSSDSSDDTILGSATMVAPGIALSATHNLADILPELRRGGMTMMCIGIASTGAQAWKVHKVTPIAGTDICILGLLCASEIPQTRTFYEATMTTRLPAIGERLLMTGYRASSTAFRRDNERTTNLEASLYISSGVVTQQFVRSRDSAKLPSPTLEVDCPTLGGMSGGPVFASRGYLVGMVTSAVVGGHEPAPTYTALLWPIFGHPFQGGWPSTLVGSEPKSLLDMNARHLCKIEQPEAVSLSLEGARLSISYKPWSRLRATD